MDIVKKIKSIATRLFIWSKEHRWGGVRYFYINNNSPVLLIIFSGFGSDDHRVYNYIKSLIQLKCDKVYILDNWGYKGSYYWFENGMSYPEERVTLFINQFVKNKKYKKVCTAGSSKGGTCALYYGLLCNANEIYAGACQYRIGNYLSIPIHQKIMEAMMGSGVGVDKIELLNNKLKNVIYNRINPDVRINLQYSKVEQEKTYQTDMSYMIDDLKANGYSISEKEESFSKHADIGYYFPGYVIENIKNEN